MLVFCQIVCFENNIYKALDPNNSPPIPCAIFGSATHSMLHTVMCDDSHRIQIFLKPSAAELVFTAQAA